jgi:hypothetical protein
LHPNAELPATRSPYTHDWYRTRSGTDSQAAPPSQRHPPSAHLFTPWAPPAAPGSPGLGSLEPRPGGAVHSPAPTHFPPGRPPQAAKEGYVQPTWGGVQRAMASAARSLVMGALWVVLVTVRPCAHVARASACLAWAHPPARMPTRTLPQSPTPLRPTPLPPQRWATHPGLGTPAAGGIGELAKTIALQRASPATWRAHNATWRGAPIASATLVDVLAMWGALGLPRGAASGDAAAAASRAAAAAGAPGKGKAGKGKGEEVAGGLQAPATANLPPKAEAPARRAHEASAEVAKPAAWIFARTATAAAAGAAAAAAAAAGGGREADGGDSEPRLDGPGGWEVREDGSRRWRESYELYEEEEPRPASLVGLRMPSCPSLLKHSCTRRTPPHPGDLVVTPGALLAPLQPLCACS